MNAKSKKGEAIFDPILAEVYRVRDAYARKFNFNIDAICDALHATRPQRRTAPVLAPRAIAIPQGISRVKNRPAGLVRK
ncbi:MAG: hypothetical protein ACKVQK_01415 [Burkholderiales bacterium]